VYAIKEDYTYLKNNKVSSKDETSGKLFLVDTSDVKTHHIFLDDNIKAEDGNSVDIWDVYKKERVNFSEAVNVYLCRVDFIQAVMDSEYYVKQVTKCLEERAKKLETMASERVRIEEQKAVDSKASEKEFLKSCAPSKFLEKAIFPHLIPALGAI
jgi:hypothetical protein